MTLARMTRAEYMSCNLDEQQDHHNRYYLGLALEAEIRVSEDLLRRCRKSRDPHFNDVALSRWDALANIQKPQIARANKAINGQATWSLCCGVCALKALARHIIEGENA